MFHFLYYGVAMNAFRCSLK